MVINERYEIKKIDGARAQIIDLEHKDEGHVIEVASTDLSEEEIVQLLEPLLKGLNEHDNETM